MPKRSAIKVTSESSSRRPPLLSVVRVVFTSSSTAIHASVASSPRRPPRRLRVVLHSSASSASSSRRPPLCSLLSTSDNLEQQSSRLKYEQTSSKQNFTIHCCPDGSNPQFQQMSKSNSSPPLPFDFQLASLENNWRNQANTSSHQSNVGRLWTAILRTEEQANQFHREKPHQRVQSFK